MSNSTKKDSVARTPSPPQGSSESETRSPRRTATVYDAVAGRVGLNGFLSTDQLKSGRIVPLTPEEVLLRRVNAPDQVPFDYYNHDQRLNHDQELPDSDLLKEIHRYTSHFYEAAPSGRGKYRFRSLDETALIAIGVLLEEAAREATAEVLADHGNVALTEPEGLENVQLGHEQAKHQVMGRVKRQPDPEIPGSSSSSGTDTDSVEAEARRPRKRRYRGPNDADDHLENVDLR